MGMIIKKMKKKKKIEKENSSIGINHIPLNAYEQQFTMSDNNEFD